MDEKRVYTGMSAKAVKGLKRLMPDRDIYVSSSPSGNGYTVVTKQKDDRPGKRKDQGQDRG